MLPQPSLRTFLLILLLNLLPCNSYVQPQGPKQPKPSAQPKSKVPYYYPYFPPPKTYLTYNNEKSLADESSSPLNPREVNVTKRDLLLESNLPLIPYFTKHYPESIREDMLSTASLALIISSEKYNGSSRFASYAGLWVKAMCRREARRYNYGWGGMRKAHREWDESSKQYYQGANGTLRESASDRDVKVMKSPLDVDGDAARLNLHTYDEGYEVRNFIDSLYTNLPETLTEFEKLVFLTRSNCDYDGCDLLDLSDAEFQPDLLSFREVCHRLRLDYETQGNRVAKGWAGACRKIRNSDWAAQNEDYIKNY
ncbi:hypothetical protein TrST_g1341 [Triparma strigata]|uniref:RNA polymerase sigma-70 region 2 domain-containing protein n=1 Tax=Triparma strigata TaxID=1606541 RepID=A0A9W7BR51_9STRA|nr:hypothetical protein TrST_g1341 [Triparma strigata]